MGANRLSMFPACLARVWRWSPGRLCLSLIDPITVFKENDAEKASRVSQLTGGLEKDKKNKKYKERATGKLACLCMLLNAVMTLSQMFGIEC